MGYFDNIPVVSDVEDGAGTVATAIADVPADAVNATTGTGENLGWFGVVDRNLDYRVLTGEMDADSDEWAEPSDETMGISGFLAATGQQAGAASEDAGAGLWTILKQSPALLAAAAVVVAVVVRPYIGLVEG
jgi:hypothetical protein